MACTPVNERQHMRLCTTVCVAWRREEAFALIYVLLSGGKLQTLRWAPLISHISNNRADGLHAVGEQRPAQRDPA